MLCKVKVWKNIGSFSKCFFLYKYFFYFLKTISKQFKKKKKTSNFDATTVQKQPKRGQCPTIYSKLNECPSQ
jgi:hypothetical protein